jgi:hypothetical protein
MLRYVLDLVVRMKVLENLLQYIASFRWDRKFRAFAIDDFDNANVLAISTDVPTQLYRLGSKTTGPQPGLHIATMGYLGARARVCTRAVRRARVTFNHKLCQRQHILWMRQCLQAQLAHPRVRWLWLHLASASSGALAPTWWWLEHPRVPWLHGG